MHRFKYHFLHSSSLVTWRQNVASTKIDIDSHDWRKTRQRNPQNFLPTLTFWGQMMLGGGVDFPANVVHFELVCPNHKFRICQIAIVIYWIKVCIQQMLHGLKKQYRSVLTKVQESYHNLFFIKPLGSLGPFKWQDSLSPCSPSDRPSPRIFLFNLILLLLTDNSLLLKMCLLLWSPSQTTFYVLCPVFCRRFENGCNLSPDWRWFVGKVMIANISCRHESDCRHFLTTSNLWSKSQGIFSTSQTFKKGKLYIWGKINGAET